MDLLPPDLERTEVLLAPRTLSGYATVLRYPDALESATEEEYQNALALARGVFTWAKRIVGEG